MIGICVLYSEKSYSLCPLSTTLFFEPFAFLEPVTSRILHLPWGCSTPPLLYKEDNISRTLPPPIGLSLPYWCWADDDCSHASWKAHPQWTSHALSFFSSLHLSLPFSGMRWDWARARMITTAPHRKCSPALCPPAWFWSSYKWVQGSVPRNA